MSPEIRRLVITLAVLLLAGAVVATMVLGPRRAAPPQPPDVASGKAAEDVMLGGMAHAGSRK